MELVNGGEMFEIIKDSGSYSGKNLYFKKLKFTIEATAKLLFKQILQAIKYMHKSGVCHRDLKPNNILCDCNFYSSYLLLLFLKHNK